jgi:hypothetical protein
MVGPRIGALSLAAILAVAVAALRGTHTYLADRRTRRLAAADEAAPLREARAKQKLAELEAAGKHQLAMRGIADKSAQQRAKNNSRVPSSAEFGRKTLGNRSGGSGSGGGGRGSGGGGGRSNGVAKPRSGNGSGPASRKNGPGSKGGGHSGTGSKKRSLLGGGHKNKLGNGNGSGGSKTPRKHDTSRTPKPKSPHRPTQSGSRTGLDKQRTKNNPRPKDGNSGKGGKQRRSLPDALAHDTHKAARKRLKQRRKGNLDNPVLWKNTRTKPRDDKAKKTPKTNTAGGPDMRRLDQAAWHDLKQAAARRWKKRRTTPPIWGDPKKVNLRKPKKNRTAQADTANTRQTRTRRRNQNRWAKARDYLKNKTRTPRSGAFRGTPGGTGPGPGTAGPHPGGRGRRSPFANAGAAAGTTWTVTSDHVPGSRAKRWEPDALTKGTPTLPTSGPAALEAAPTKTFPRPGTSRPKEPIPMYAAKPDARLAKARNQAARTGQAVINAAHMDAQHETEITLDDAIDDYDQFKDDAFKTHDQCHKLASRARKLRDILADFAVDLAVNHNLIGALFSVAMARLAESMDLLARMADEMLVSSLEAAEMAETAANDLNDAYRPYNVATADAGLSTPSAPIHNEA